MSKSKSKTPTQKYIDDAVTKAVKQSNNGSSFTSCDFYGVKWDDKAVEAIKTIADGLIVNAQGLGKLAEVLRASNIRIDAMVKIDGGNT